jgi:hypothetical protein
VDGTWNVHKALLDTSLDSFVLFSSSSGLAGHCGQANYGAATTFLDAFTQYRHALGLPASVIDLGPMEDVGAIAERTDWHDYFHDVGFDMISDQDMRESVTNLHLPRLPRASRLL